MAYWATLDDLVSVIPVAQSQTRGDATLSLLSIDCYAGGWVTNLRVHYPDPTVTPVFTFFPKPDNRRARQYGGGDGFGPWRYDAADPNCYLTRVFIPPLAAEPVPLVFNVEVIRFTDRPRGEGGILVTEIWGPWHFEVDPCLSRLAPKQESDMQPGVPLNTTYLESRKAETLSTYGTVFGTLLDIFYKYDPHGIAWLDPSGADWYAGILANILHGVSYARSTSDVVNILVHEFSARWNCDLTRNPRLEELAEEVWAAWQREGDTIEPPSDPVS